MTKLIWHQPGSARFEYGVDRGVFYPEVSENRYDNGVVWNGLVSVEEEADGGEAESFFFDGVKYIDLVSPKTFKANLTALSYPKQLAYALGDLPVVAGFILTR